MMKKSIYFILFTLVMVLFTSCNEEDLGGNGSGRTIAFASGINDYNLRINNNGDEWETGDNVGIYTFKHGEKVVAGTENVKHTTTSAGKSTSFTSETPLYYPTDGSTVDFMAYYPYSTSINNMKYPIVLSDQSDQTALDLMYAENNVGYNQTNESAVELKFNHVLTKIVMNITSSDNNIDINSMTVKVKGMDRTADFDLLSKTISARSSNGEITACSTSEEGRYELILLPVGSLENSHVVEFTTNDESYTWTMSDNTVDTGGSINLLESGHRYTFNITISDSGVEAVATKSSGSITPWEDGSGNGTAEKDEQKNNFFVSTTGNDENPGTLASPWRTIQKAVTTVGPGSIVNITGGTYYEGINVTVSGAPDQYIVIKNYNDEEVIISGNNTPKELMTLYGVSYIKIKGLTFADCLGSYSVGLKISTSSDEASHHIEVESNTFRNLYADASTTTYPPNVYAGAITVAGYHPSKAIHDIIIKGNTVRDCRTGWTEAIGITGNVDGFIVTKNVVTNTGNIGIDASGHWGISSDPNTDYARNGVISENRVSYCKSLVEGGAGIYLDGSSNMLVEKNISHNNVYGITIGCEIANKSVSNNIIRNNVCYHNEAFGIGLTAWSPQGRIIKDCQIINNTTFGNATESTKKYLGELALISTESITVKNNIFYSTNSYSNILYVDDKADNLQLSFNNYYCSSPNFNFFWKGTTYSDFDQYKNAKGNDLTSAFCDPLFTNIESFDFQLEASSPCIDAGDTGYTPSANELDLNNKNRKVGDCIDKGAYEKQ